MTIIILLYESQTSVFIRVKAVFESNIHFHFLKYLFSFSVVFIFTDKNIHFQLFKNRQYTLPKGDNKHFLL